jgi:hypothetical protein
VTLIGGLWLVLALMAAIAIVCSTLVTGIAPMPSSRRACDAMIEAARDAPDGPLIDLGSGWGTLAISAARAFPQRSVIGYEVSVVPWAMACTSARLLGLRNLSFRRRDFLDVDLGEADVLLCYLFRDGMAQLAYRLGPPRRRPQLLISNSFTLPGLAASRVVRLPDLRRTCIFVYRLDA